MQNSQEWTLHDWNYINHVQRFWDFCREHLKKCGFDGKDYLLRDIIGKNIVNNRLPMGGNSSWLDKIR